MERLRDLGLTLLDTDSSVSFNSYLVTLVREILSEPPRGADWLALTGGIPIYEY